jgi:nucleotide-binding universal stress UspA family protein
MYKHILVPLDGSTLAERALPHALEIARYSEGVLHLLRVALGQTYVASKGGAELYPVEVLQQVCKGAEGHLGGIRSECQAKGAAASAQVLAGPVAESTVHLAKDKHIDLSVMSTHGRSGLSRWLYGSVADSAAWRALPDPHRAWRPLRQPKKVWNEIGAPADRAPAQVSQQPVACSQTVPVPRWARLFQAGGRQPVRVHANHPHLANREPGRSLALHCVRRDVPHA